MANAAKGNQAIPRVSTHIRQPKLPQREITERKNPREHKKTYAVKKGIGETVKHQKYHQKLFLIRSNKKEHRPEESTDK